MRGLVSEKLSGGVYRWGMEIHECSMVLSTELINNLDTAKRCEC